MKRVVIVGAGFGGLAAAAELARAGVRVTVLEANVYPGGCASTFYHQGYRFESGATLAGGFATGGPLDFLGHRFDIDWGARPSLRAMTVHLPGHDPITRWSDHGDWQNERLVHFGRQAEPFWHWQESTADALWKFALKLVPWQPQSLSDLAILAKTSLNWINELRGTVPGRYLATILRDAFQPVIARIPESLDLLRLYIDAQLLISTQTTSRSANALFGAVALDLARQGVASVPGGMGGMAAKLVQAVRRFGGDVIFRQAVTGVKKLPDGTYRVKTKRKDIFPADILIMNMPPWNIFHLLDPDLPGKLRRLGTLPIDGWGAFMVYIGLEDGRIPDDLALHHQVIIDEPLGEGNSLFLSMSPGWDSDRAPDGRRALTISTHTNLGRWWELHDKNHSAYESQRAEFTEQILAAAEKVIPNLRQSAELVIPGTPVSFQRFTRRVNGWVGGFPQTNLFRTWGPRLDRRLWMVGDTIFPGQSVPAVMLGGLRVADDIINRYA